MTASEKTGENSPEVQQETTSDNLHLQAEDLFGSLMGVGRSVIRARRQVAAELFDTVSQALLRANEQDTEDLSEEARGARVISRRRRTVDTVTAALDDVAGTVDRVTARVSKRHGK